MGQCEAWLNGSIVGTVQWDDGTNRVSINCTLPDGWIYRAVLLSDEKEIGSFGVLIPKDGRFLAELQLPVQFKRPASLHCEVLRSCPGETFCEGEIFTMSQLSTWEASAFPLESVLCALISRNKKAYYRIYHGKRFLLLEMQRAEPDPAVCLYTVGKPLKIKERWFLCLMIDREGKIILWPGDGK